MLINSILAGMMIAIGGRAFLACENRYLGAFLFCIGLIYILYYDWNLYTGKVCYILSNTKIQNMRIPFVVLGNCIGTLFFGTLLSCPEAITLCNAKLQTPLYVVYVKAALCNILIFLAVDFYKKYNSLIGTVFCIPIFILCGFEHSIADMAYFSMARMWNRQTIIFIIVTIMGNAIGGVFIPSLQFINNSLHRKIK